MIIKEYIEFERGQNPKKSLRIGVHHLIPQIIEKFEESPFELTRRGEVLDLEQKYEVSPENFHNPAGHPKYDWEFVYIMEDFEVSILYMIDLNNGEILRKMKVSNPRIDAEYIDNENWKITSLNPDKIYEEIDQDYALIDIADAAEYLWDMYQKQIEEEEFEDEEIDESLDFERGKTPEQIKRDLRGHFRPGEILLRPDNGYSPHQTIMVFKRITPPNYAGEQYYEVATLGYINTKGEVKTYGSSRFAMDDSNKGNMVSIDTKTRFPNKEEELLIKRFLNKSKIWKIKEAIGIYPILNGKSLSLTESIDFVRGMDPKDSMEIGRIEERREALIDWIIEQDPMKWSGSSVLAPFITRRHPHPWGWDMKKFEDASLMELNHIKEYIEKWEAVDKKYNVFDGPASKVHERLDFERGIDPKDSMNIGRVEERKIRNLFDEIGNIFQGEKTFSSDEKRVVGDFEYRGKIYRVMYDSEEFLGTKYAIVIINPDDWGKNLYEQCNNLDQCKEKLLYYMKQAENIKESLNFERGMDPKQSMDIGINARINKITSSDLEFLKIYTNDGDGKGHANPRFFEDVYGDSLSFNEYLERAKRTYDLLEPFEYLFGDHFPSDMKKEMREYVKSYLKNPKYNYAYNCDIMGDGDIDVFFSEIKLPSAELLGKKSGLKESVNFERGIDPKKSMQIGVKAKIKHGMNCLLQSSRNFSSRISTINLAGDRNNLWLEISDYGTPNFEDFIESCLSPEYFEQIYLKAKPRKYKSTSQNKWVLVIKTQYKSAFRACFDNQGYIIESINFERGLDREKLRIGNIRPVEKLKKDYDNIQELVQTSKYSDFQLPFGEEVLKSIPDTNHFGWGNIQNNFKNMNREELFPFELIVRKYTKLMGLE